MAKDKEHKGSPHGTAGKGTAGRTGGRAQQEQGGNASQQGGERSREDAETLDEGAQSGSSPRSRTDAPDEAEGGGRR